jgi:hypothetical protein
MFRISQTYRAAAALAAGLAAMPATLAAQKGPAGPAPAGASTPQNVNVVNTPTVSVGNSPTVMIGNSPTVNLGNTANVDIINGASAPLPTVDHSAQGAVTLFFSCNIGNAMISVACFESYSVPAGKRLVIEDVGIHGFGPSGQKFFARLNTKQLNSVFGNSGLGVDYDIPADGFENGTVTHVAAGRLARIYVEAGAPIGAMIFRTAATGTGAFVITINGRLVDIQ